MTKVKLIYFKSSGKYYSEGSFSSKHDLFWDIVAEIKGMLSQGKRPGLIDGYDFNVLAEIFDENGPMLHLFVRRSNVKTLWNHVMLPIRGETLAQMEAPIYSPTKA